MQSISEILNIETKEYKEKNIVREEEFREGYEKNNHM